MSQLLKFGLILSAICLAATLVLAVTYEVTKPKIDEQMRREEQEALKAVMPQADSFVAGSVDGIDYFESLKGGVLVGYCIKITATGYNGYIRMIAGVDTDGVIQGIKVLEHSETPGLGARINEIKIGEKEPWFLVQFKGKPARTVTVKKDVDAITSATISSTAVTDGVRNAANAFFEKVKR